MTQTAAAVVKQDGPERLSLLCVPYDSPELIGIAGPDGPVLFREMFTADSWANLPERVPINDAHDPEKPLGWVHLHSEPDGLHGDVELISTHGASDALQQVKAGLRVGVSIGFIDDPKADVWSRPVGSRQLPQVLRRGADLQEVSLVSRAAYASARVLAVTRSSWQHQESERVMAPYRAERQREDAQQLQAQRAQDQALLQELDRLAAVRWGDEALSAPVSHQDSAQAGSPQPASPDGAVAVSVAGRRYRVRGATSQAQALAITTRALQQEGGCLAGGCPYGAHLHAAGVQSLDAEPY